LWHLSGIWSSLLYTRNKHDKVGCAGRDIAKFQGTSGPLHTWLRCRGIRGTKKLAECCIDPTTFGPTRPKFGASSPEMPRSTYCTAGSSHIAASLASCSPAAWHPTTNSILGNVLILSDSMTTITRERGEKSGKSSGVSPLEGGADVNFWRRKGKGAVKKRQSCMKSADGGRILNCIWMELAVELGTEASKRRPVLMSRFAA